MEDTICIVGAGSTCLAFVHYYTEKMKALPTGAPKTLYVIEKSEEFGCGVAYASDLSSNILNTKSGSISPFIDKPGDFFQWLGSNKAMVSRCFPDFAMVTDSYAPRPLFGAYLKDRFKTSIKDAAAVGVNVVQIFAEVTDIVRTLRGYLIYTSCGVSLKCGSVFMMCGTLAPRQAEGQQEASMLAHPYPVSQLPSVVRSDDAVAVIGSRLSCIDTVIAL
ncbi:MAG: FAD/NAD(P)-binding protein, partial [Hafnia sp.]